MDGHPMNEYKFKCCYCAQSIESSSVDPTDISVIINIDKEKDQQMSQDFYCHVNCFREKLHDSIKMHFHLHNILDD